METPIRFHSLFHILAVGHSREVEAVHTISSDSNSEHQENIRCLAGLYDEQQVRYPNKGIIVTRRIFFLLF